MPENIDPVTLPPFLTNVLSRSSTNEHPKTHFPTPHAENAFRPGTSPHAEISLHAGTPSRAGTSSHTKVHPKEQLLTSKKAETTNISNSPADSGQRVFNAEGFIQFPHSDPAGSRTGMIWFTGASIVGLCFIGICLFALTSRKSRSASRQKDDETTTT